MRSIILYKVSDLQQKQITNTPEIAEQFRLPPEGRILALDPGTRRVGVAVCDPLRVTARPVETIERRSWKALLAKVASLVRDFDAVAVVVGLPLASDGGESQMSIEARSMARKFTLSLSVPVFLQDERVTSYEAKRRLWEQGASLAETRERVDSEAAAVILEDFLSVLDSQPATE